MKWIKLLGWFICGQPKRSLEMYIRSIFSRFSVGVHPVYRRSEYSAGPVQQRLVRLAKRWQRYRTCQDAPRTICFVSLMGILLGVLAAAFIPLTLSIVVTVVVVVFGGLVLVGRLLVLPPVWEVALAYDWRLQLRERLSTALEPGLHTDSEMLQLQRNDAIRVLDAVDESESFPYALRGNGHLFLVTAVGALGAWLLLVALGLVPSSFARRQSPELVALASGGSVVEKRDESGVVVGARTDQLRSAISELRQQRDPRAVDTAEAIQQASESLRRTSESRYIGRSLASGDFRAAAMAIQDLATQASGLTRASQENLAEGFRQAVERANLHDSEFSGHLANVAYTLEQGHLGDARSAMKALASEVESMGITVETNNRINENIRGLERQLAEAASTSNVSESFLGLAAGDGSTSSVSEGKLVEGGVEALSPKERLNVEGRLEVVRIEPTAKSAELRPYKLNEVGSSEVPQIESWTTDGGVAVGRRDFSRVIPADFLPTLDRYLLPS